MKLYSLLLLLLFAYGSVFAQSRAKLPTEGKNVAAFIPKGWKKTFSVESDFNKDGFNDAAMLITKDQQSELVILSKNEDESYNRSFAETFSSIEYVSKLGKRSNTLEITFDLPSYSAGHIIKVYGRFQNYNGIYDWMIIGYSEETYEDNDQAAKSKVAKGLFKDVNLVTGEVVESTIAGTKRTFKKKYKQKVETLIALKNIDSLPVMNW